MAAFHYAVLWKDVCSANYALGIKAVLTFLAARANVLLASDIAN
jgi:hypothetical protein